MHVGFTEVQKCKTYHRLYKCLVKIQRETGCLNDSVFAWTAPFINSRAF